MRGRFESRQKRRVRKMTEEMGVGGEKKRSKRENCPDIPL